VVAVAGDPEARLGEGTEGRGPLKPGEKKQLLDVLRGIGAIADTHRRISVVTEFEEVYGARLGLDGPVDALTILNVSLRIGRPAELADILELFVEDDEEDTRRVEEFRRLVAEFTAPPMLRPSRRLRLAELVEDVPLDRAVRWLRHPWLAGFVTFPVEDLRSTAEAAARLADLGPRTSGVPPLLVLLELLAHRDVTGFREVELHRFIHELEVELGRADDVRALCEQLSGGTADLTELTDPAADAVVGPGEDIMINSTSGYAVYTRVTAPPAIWGGVPPRNPHFTGREDLVAMTREALHGRHAPAALVPQALHGLGGVGKTQLAAEYAHRFQNEYDLVWWILADDERNVRRSFVSLARRLNLAESPDVQQMVDGALDAQRQDPKYARWLLVFDNAEDPEHVRRYLPSGDGHVLITSRNRHWAGEANVVEVDVFSPEESVELLTKRWQGLGEAEARVLADRLGHLPIALDQAVAFHEQTGASLARYLELFETSPARLLRESTATGYSTPVAVTWQIAFDQLGEKSAGAAQLLQLCAMISSQPIAVSMLLRGRGADRLPEAVRNLLNNELELRRAVREIGRYALAQLDPGRDLIRIHMLVRTVIRDGLTDEQAELMQTAAHQVLGLANPGQPDNPDHWRMHGQLTSHVVPSEVIFSPLESARQVALDQVRYLYAIGDFHEAKALGKQALEVWHGSLGPNDPMTLVAGRHLANSLRALGEYREARELDQQTLERMQQELGVDHEHSVATARSVAADYRLVGSFEQARSLDDESLERHRRIFGPDDPDTLRAANNLGVDYRLLGRFRDALTIDLDTRLRRSRVFGEEHPETLYSYSCVARDMYGLGDYVEALELQREKLAIHERKLEVSDHGDLLYARRNMAIMLRKAGFHGPALLTADANYEIYRNRFGRRHEHTLGSMVTLVNTLRVIGLDPGGAAESREAALIRARDLGEEAFTHYREAFGVEHPFTLACATNVGIVLRALDQHADAMERDARTLASLERVLGAEHPWTLCSAANMTNNLAVAGDAAEALARSEEVVARSRAVRSEDHPYTLLAAANLALDLAADGRVADAAATRNDTLSRLRRRLGPDHHETINVERERRAESDIETPPT
jgi:tetratricopeptide (TPR) repeat protein